jgi:hypothetical protein
MLSGAELKELLERHLGEHYRSAVGQILYSGIETLSPGTYYVVGLNPRPDNSNRVLNEIPLELRRWSAYTCQCWDREHRHHREHPAFLHCRGHDHSDCKTNPCDNSASDIHQRRVFGLLKQLTEGTEINPLDVFATNIFFVQTEDSDELKDKYEHEFSNFWEIHRRFLREVKPSYVICLGYGDDFSAFSLMHRQKTNVARITDSETPHRWKNDPHIKWFHGEYSLDDGTTLCTRVAGIFHPSYRSIPTTVRTLLEQIPAPKRQAVRG